MTEAMPFLQKAILLSYGPRPLPRGFVCYLCIWPLTACRPWAHQVTVRLMRLTSKEVWDRVCRERSPISRVTEKMSVEAS